jgi:integrase
MTTPFAGCIWVFSFVYWTRIGLAQRRAKPQGEKMPRKVRDSKLDTRTARASLKANVKPYFRLIEPGLFIGYRRLPGDRPGTWVARRYDPDQRTYTVKNLKTADARLVFADDKSEADGETILTFGQAQAAAKVEREQEAFEKLRPYTVRQAINSYLKSKEADGRDVVDSKCRSNAHILPSLGDLECNKLTKDEIQDWHRSLAKAAPRTRTKAGTNQQFRKFSGDKDAVRRRQASANRVMTILKAALNQAFENGRVASDSAWRKVKRFKGVDMARLRYLTMAEAKHLINTTDSDFRKLVQGALQSGARYGQLAELVVSDFHADTKGNGTLQLRSRKGDGTEKVYHATLTAEGASFFKVICGGRPGNELMFRNVGRIQRATDREKVSREKRGELTDGIVIDGGYEWRESEQLRLMAAACERAKIKPPIGFHGLRHTWASHAVMNGVPLLVVAKNLGHSDTRMVEKHYGHLAPSYITDAIRANAPKFGFKPDTNVVPLARHIKARV